MKFIVNNEETQVKSSLLVSMLKSQYKFNDDVYQGENFISEFVLENLKKRLEVPLPLDKTFVYEAINEYTRLNELVNNKVYKIVL